MRKTLADWALTFCALVFLVSCSPQGAKPKECFDDIRDLVVDKTTAEVESRLGEPDYRQPLSHSGERWVWYNYTYLNCNSYPPEERRQVVHLEIIFDPVAASAGGLRVKDPLAVSYTIPQPARK